MSSPPRNNAVVNLGTFYTIQGDVDHQATYIPYSMVGDMPINYRHRWVNGHWDDGGPWLSRKRVHVNSKSGRNTILGYGSIVTYAGSFISSGIGYPDYYNMLVDPSGLGLYSSLKNTGADYLAKNSPVQPSFQAAASLYELKDVPATLKQATRGIIEAISDIRKRAKKAPYHGPGIDYSKVNRRGNPYRKPKGKKSEERPIAGKVGDWHLALSFGWMPILTDIRNFVKAQRELDQRLRWIIRNEGKPIRQSSRIEESNQSSFDYTVAHGTPYNPYMSPSLVVHAYAGGNATTRFRQKVLMQQWFEGQCRYILPPGPRDQIWNRKMLRRLMGKRITPQAVWAVMPWSWLVDYFIDVGAFIEATQNGVADLLVWDYAYVMCDYQIVTETIANQFVRTVGNPNGEQVTASWHAQIGYKVRVKASPFGFGLSMTDLSARQIGILGALGMSRLWS